MRLAIIAFFLLIVSVSVPAAASENTLLSKGDISHRIEASVKTECATLADFYAELLKDMNHCEADEDCKSIFIKNSYGCRQLVHKNFTGWEDQIYQWDRMLDGLCRQRLKYPECMMGSKGKTPIECRDHKCVCTSMDCDQYKRIKLP